MAVGNRLRHHALRKFAERVRTLCYLDKRGAAALLAFYSVRLGAESVIIAVCFGLGQVVGAAPVLSVFLGITLALIPFAIIRNTGYLLKLRLLARAPLVRRLTVGPKT